MFFQGGIRKAGDQLVRRRFGSIPELTTGLYASLVEYLISSGAIHTGPFDAAVCSGATMTDISRAKITSFLERAQAERDYALGPRTPVQKALTHLNLLAGERPTHAAILLFGKKPQRFMITSEVKCMHFHGLEVRKPIPSYHIYKGDLFEMVDQAADFVMSKLARAVIPRDGKVASDVEYELPWKAVREAIVNAVTHRDYASNGSVQVMLFADRLEIWNPGELPPALSVAKLHHPHPSLPRNPLIADPMFLTRYAEKAGSGILDMLQQCQDAGLREPEFRQDGGFFVQTLWRPKSVAASQGNAQVGTKSGPSRDQVKILRKCLEISGISDLMALVSRSNRTKFRDQVVKPLLEEGLIEMTIPSKPTSRLQKYRLTAKGRVKLDKDAKG
jgi:predicted HTH transcriptional regulator